jgi:hypothetical protein
VKMNHIIIKSVHGHCDGGHGNLSALYPTAAEKVRFNVLTYAYQFTAIADASDVLRTDALKIFLACECSS